CVHPVLLSFPTRRSSDLGAPIFAQFKGGIAMILSPTFGFIISFILIAYVAGKIAEKKRTLPMYIIAALTGTAINYIFGTNWMYAAYLFWFEAPEGFTYKLAWLWMIVPLPKDILLAIFAGSLAYRLEKITLISSKIKNQRHTA